MAGVTGLREADLHSMASAPSELGGIKAQRPGPSKPSQGPPQQTEVQMWTLMLLLSVSNRLKDLEACSYYTHFLPTESDLFQAQNQSIQAYMALVQEEGKEHTRGPPYIHVARATLTYLAASEELKAKSGMAPIVIVIEAYLKEFEAMPLDEAGDDIGHMRIVKAYDNNFKKMQFHMPKIVKVGEKTTSLASCVSRLLTSLGYKRKHGKAPAGFLDNQLSSQIETLKQQLGK